MTGGGGTAARDAPTHGAHRARFAGSDRGIAQRNSGMIWAMTDRAA